MNKIPLVDLQANYRSIKEEVNTSLQQVLEQQAFVLGAEVKKFEDGFARFNESKYAIGVANGTEGIHLGLKALSIEEGDEVILAPTTFIATAEAISYLGAKPVFVDCDAETANIDPSSIEKAITEKTKAIIPVHMYGYPCFMDKIMQIAKKHNLKVLEDCSHAHGSKYKGKTIGNFGNLGVFSLFPAKILGAYGDAGVITVNNKELYKKIMLLRDHGRPSKYDHIIIGYNCRLDNLQASILNVKLKYLPLWIKKRRELADYYNKNLNKLVDVTKEEDGIESAYYMYIIRTPKRDELSKFLSEKGISTGIHYPISLHLQPAYSFLKHTNGSFKNSENWSKNILSIPLYPELSKDQADYIIESIKAFFQEK